MRIKKSFEHCAPKSHEGFKKSEMWIISIKNIPNWDEKYFFFTSRRSSFAVEINVLPMYQQLTQALNQPGNGNDGIYWVDSNNFLQFKERIKR